jgi:hypothetical protein
MLIYAIAGAWGGEERKGSYEGERKKTIQSVER